MTPKSSRILQVLAFALLAAALLAAPSAAGPAPRFRVVEFNIRFDFQSDGENRWEKRAELVAGLIRAARASVACLQEDKEEQVKDLEKLLPGWEFVGVGREGGRTERCSVAFDTSVWRRLDHGDFWLSDTPDVPSSNTWGTKYPHKVTWARLQLLQPGKMPPVLFLSTHLDEEPEHDEIRRKSVAVIRAWLAKNATGATVICGDFNAGEGEPAYAAMSEAHPAPQPLDAWQVVRPKENSPGSVHRFTGQSWKKRIDWIFTANNLQARDIALDRYNRDGRWPSDHFALVAEIEILPPRPNSGGKAPPVEAR